MVVLTDVLRLVSWLIQEIGLGFPNADPGGLCGRLLCPSFSKVELFTLQDEERLKMKECGHNNLGESCF